MNNYSQGGDARGAKLRAGVAGASGYAGREVARLLRAHPAAELAAEFGSAQPPTPEAARAARLDVLFLATPPEVSMAAAAAAETGVRVVDLSGAFRLGAEEFAHWYRLPHAAPALLAEAVYGWPEKNAAAIAGARLVSNPGCYATAALTAAWPLAQAGWLAAGPVVCDAKSGASGAGKGLRQDLHFCELAGNCKAYGVLEHRHTPEIVRHAGLAPDQLLFTPHLLPVVRGLIATTYLPLARPAAPEALLEVYRAAYAASPFTRVLPPPELPDLNGVVGGNYCDLGLRVHAPTQTAVVVTSLDNLLKGAAGQAVENMNLMFGLPRAAGLA
jgi:N-acetyl-gamma-glutamyl-phosphate reductase